MTTVRFLVPCDRWFSNRIGHLLDGEDAADVFMSWPVLLWSTAAAEIDALA